MYMIPDPNSVNNVADWAEFYVILAKEELSKTQLNRCIEDASGSEAADDFVDSVWLEMEGREQLYGDNPPFRVQSSLIVPAIDWEEYPEYMTCLIFSLEGNPVDPLRSGTLFERITNEAIRSFLGGESLAVGFPTTMAVVDMAAALGEKYVTDPPWYAKDRKLDVIAWKPFGDCRASQVVVLVQCAAGHNWPSKTAELGLNAWCKYVHFACTPIKGFAIPVIISGEVELEEHSSDAGLIIDRARIYRNMIDTSLRDAALRQDLKTWCTNRLGDML
jgi:hypothetical protein